MTQHPWTQSGLELLATIQSYVSENGGRTELARTIEIEWNPVTTCPESYTKKREIIAELYGTIPSIALAEKVGVCDSQVRVMISELLLIGRIKRLHNGKAGGYYKKKSANVISRHGQRVGVKREQFQHSFD